MSNFTMRTSCPCDYNKNYMRTSSGGWNTCIQGSPCKYDADVLANCVGYASGRFNEIINEARGTTGCTYKYLNCNAENFVERALAAGLKIGSEPRKGAIMCWQKGSLSSGDGAGHVAIVERVNSSDSVYDSESGYGSSYFWNATRSRYSGNGWGIGGDYKFRCFIYLPDDVQKIIDDGPTPTPTGKFNIGDEVILNGPIYVSSTAANPANYIENLKTTITRKLENAPHPYNTEGDLGWCDESSLTKVEPEPPTPTLKYKVGDEVIINGQLYGDSDGNNPGQIVYDRVTHITRAIEGKLYPYNTTGDLGWMAEAAIKPYVKPEPTPLKVGDTVRIIDYGRASSYGDYPVAGGLGWTRKILKIYKDRAYPYQVGDGDDTIGFYKESALEKLG